MTLEKKSKSDGETNLAKLLRTMMPKLNEGEYVFCTTNSLNNIPRDATICEIKESEGVTIVLERKKAEKFNLKYNYIASWITLEVHSSLEAVGLTAAFSNHLAKKGISCNVIAGYYHDHIFVDVNNATRALDVLNELSQEVDYILK